jgi:predicted TIM-barrel fold metal-dependent hydrolase
MQYFRISVRNQQKRLLIKNRDMLATGIKGICCNAEYVIESVHISFRKHTAKEIIRKYSDLKLVLAHYGSNEMFDEVEELLCGERVYFDTAFILRHIGKEKFIKILEKHGADRILFATDSPWSGIKEDLDIIRSFGLDEATEQKILCDNARALLCI